ncbi:MAG TPA: hypothetical protein EYQ00_12720 [Dehalococcoidia bacterium]|nr:hypothetical protein [Dehalococcoidia bacterium]
MNQRKIHFARSALILFTLMILSLSCQNEQESIEKSTRISESSRPKTGSTQGVVASTTEAVLVSKNFTLSNTDIDRTGAYIPQNGLPTLVFNSAVG